MTNIVWWSQFIVATLGAITSAVWYFSERRRVRYISALWGVWCVLLMAYRIYRWTLITVLQDQALFINSLINWLLLLGALSVFVITIDHIIGVYKHGRAH
jgi:hypothetical protein